MMLADSLLRLIEVHSEPLAAGLLEKVDRSPLLADYRNVPPEELKRCVYDIYRHLGEWLFSKRSHDIRVQYTEIGIRRATQGVPLSQLLWAIVLTKESLWEFLEQEAMLDRPVEIFGELEMLKLLDQFFDRAQYYAAVGYEKVRSAQTALKSVRAR